MPILLAIFCELIIDPAFLFPQIKRIDQHDFVIRQAMSPRVLGLEDIYLGNGVEEEVEGVASGDFLQKLRR